MNFNAHSELKDQHAFLSASKYHWIRYSSEKLASAYLKYLAVQRGTLLHDFARRCIELGQRLPKSKKSLNQYVNDAIGFRMKPEQVLFYSENCFGTADTILFKNDFLRIHDFKSGVTPASFDQLKVYVALFCLEYDKHPSTIAIELRIYQDDEVFIEIPDIEEIVEIMEKIITFDHQIAMLKQEAD